MHPITWNAFVDELEKVATARYVKNVARGVAGAARSGRDISPAMDAMSPAMQGRVSAQMMGRHMAPAHKQRPGVPIRYLTRQFKKGKLGLGDLQRKEYTLMPRAQGPSVVPMKRPNLP